MLGGGCLGSAIAIRQDLSCLLEEEMAQPHTEGALALGGNSSPTPSLPWAWGFQLSIRECE